MKRFPSLAPILALILWVVTLAVGPVLAQSKRSASDAEDHFGGPSPPPNSHVVVQRALPAPVLDGECKDIAYQRAETFQIPVSSTIAVQFIHTGLDAYVCFDGVPAESNRILVRIDPVQNRRSEDGHQGVYEFGIERAGGLRVRQAVADGSFDPTVVPAGAFAGAVQQHGTTWDAEFRVGLDWLAGFGREGRIQIALEGSKGEEKVWPVTARATDSTTWAPLTLQPVYPAEATAGSAFFDGVAGHLVVPYSSALNPREMTIAAWVRADENKCGTIVGNGRLESYWLGVCHGRLKFASGPTGSPFEGQQFLGSSWHHVAVAIDSNGGIVLYVDGRVDRAILPQRPALGADGKPRGREWTPRLRLLAGKSTLWIGADRELPREESFLHGNLQDLAIWGRVLSAEVLRRVASSHPDSEPQGLAAYWPFTSNLRDVVGGHDAGLVGDASLAREAPARQLAPVANPVATQLTRPRTRTPWDARIPFFEQRKVKVDGLCQASEWQGAAEVRLEPGRFGGMRLLGTRNALYLCTAPLFGKGNDAVVLWIARDGVMRKQSGPNDLRLAMTAQGSLSTAVGDGTRFVPAQLPGVRVATASGSNWGWQDDEDQVQAPWWSSELEIPVAALAPFVPGRSLRLAIRYEGSLSAEAARSLRPGGRFLPERPMSLPTSQVLGYWPVTRPDDQQSSWGVVTTEFILGNAATKQSESEHGSPGPIKTPPDPTVDDFMNACDCGPFGLWCAVHYDDKWPLVDINNVIARSEGKLHDGDEGVSVSNEDSPVLHDSHDLDFLLDPSTPEAQLLALNVDSPGSQVLEVETAQLPPNDSSYWQARPDRGDHMTAVGRWVFDCGHDPKTELHPLYKIESDHTEYRAMPDGTVSPVTVARVWFNSRPGSIQPFWRDGQMEPLDFRFDWPYGSDKPPANGRGMPYLRVVDGNPSRVSIAPAPNYLRVTPPQLSGDAHTYYTSIEIGFAALRVPIPAQPLTVHLDTITAKRGPFGAIGAPNKGEGGDLLGAGWFLWANASGLWVPVWVDMYPPYDPDNAMPVAAPVNVEMNVFSDNPQLQITGYVDADSITGSGDQLASLPPMVDLSQGSHYQQTDDYDLKYHVDVLPRFPTALKDTAFWAERVKDEPNDTLPGTNLGDPVDVPPEGNTLVHSAYITEQGGTYDSGETRLLASDLDVYQFRADDFVDIDFGTLPPALKPLAFGTTATARYSNVDMTDCDRAVLGPRGAYFTVQSKTGSAGDVPYTLNITLKPKKLPVDWGWPLEFHPLKTGPPQQQVEGGLARHPSAEVPPCGTVPAPGETPGYRPVDLTGKYSTTTEQVAWQHVRGEVHHYDIKVPPGVQPSRAYIPTGCDRDPTLEIHAFGMRLTYGHLQTEKPMFGFDELTLTKPDRMFPNHHVLVEVEHPQGRRDAYQLWATFTNGFYPGPQLCEALTNAQRTGQKPLFPIRPVPIEDIVTAPGIDPVNFRVNLYGQVGYRELTVKNNKMDVVLSARPGVSVTARLYDVNGVLLGESQAVDPLLAARVPSGFVAQSHLNVSDLQPGATYLLAFTFGGAVGTTAKAQVGLSMFAAPR